MSAALDMAGDLRCALDPVAFAAERLNFIPDAWQTKVLRSSGQNILLNCSRQAGKSTTTSIIALHTAFYQPEALTLLVSPSLRQSRELGRAAHKRLPEAPVFPRPLGCLPS